MGTADQGTSYRVIIVTKARGRYQKKRTLKLVKFIKPGMGSGMRWFNWSAYKYRVFPALTQSDPLFRARFIPVVREYPFNMLDKAAPCFPCCHAST